MNDLVEVSGVFSQTPLISFVQKGKGVTNLTGEKLYEGQVIDAVQRALDAAGAKAPFFVLIADEQRLSYSLVIECDDETLPDMHTLAAAVDQSLASSTSSITPSGIAAGSVHSMPIASGEGRPRPTRPRASVRDNERASSSWPSCSTRKISQCHSTIVPPMIRALTLETLQIPFKVAFRHAAASRDATSSLWVEAITASGTRGRGESCPRPYVTGETMETAHVFFERYNVEIGREVVDLTSLRAWDGRIMESDLDANPAAGAPSSSHCSTRSPARKRTDDRRSSCRCRLSPAAFITRPFSAMPGWLTHFAPAPTSTGDSVLQDSQSEALRRSRRRIATRSPSCARGANRLRSVRADANNLWRQCGRGGWRSSC